MSLKFCFIGAGNLATHLSLALSDNAGDVIQVYSRTETSAKELANKLKCSYTIITKEIVQDADIYFIALTDSAVSKVLSQIDFHNKLLVHCSGSLPMSSAEMASMIVDESRFVLIESIRLRRNEP